jgi:hypothetical protein
MWFKIIYLNDNSWACGSDEGDFEDRAAAEKFGEENHIMGFRCGLKKIYDAEQWDDLNKQKDLEEIEYRQRVKVEYEPGGIYG